MCIALHYWDLSICICIQSDFQPLSDFFVGTQQTPRLCLLSSGLLPINTVSLHDEPVLLGEEELELVLVLLLVVTTGEFTLNAFIFC